MATRALFSKGLGGTHEFDGIVVVFRHTSCNGKDIDIKDNILWWEFNLRAGQDLVSTFADSDFVEGCCGLTLLIECHDNYSSSVDEDFPCVSDEFLFSTFERNTVNDAFTLAVLKTSLNDFELRRVNHDWYLGNIWIREGHPDESSHSLLTVDQTIIKINIKDLGAVLDLVLCDSNCCVILIVFDESLKLSTTGDVASLSDVDERNMGTMDKLLHT